MVSGGKQRYLDEIKGYHMNPLSDERSFDSIMAMLTDWLEDGSKC